MEALTIRDANAQVRQRQDAIKMSKTVVSSSKEIPASEQNTGPTNAKEVPKKPTFMPKDHPPAPPQDVFEPKSFDRPEGAKYRTGRMLGKGGFAICYEGRLRGTSEVYALKIVKSKMCNEKMSQKFQTELQIHSKMKHANIVQFHRAFAYEESTYIVMEICPNGSLMEMVKKRKYLTEPEARFYGVQMTGAIKYMHSKGIVHRDLKMGNIFLDKNMNVKIGDFGLAALLITGKDAARIRRMTLCGTPNYIAPEIMQKGRVGHDHTADIWSLGVIIFALLTGKPPFQSTSQEDIYRRARERIYEWPTRTANEHAISVEAKDLVQQLLQDADSRPGPDAIVEHPFFLSGPMPNRMTRDNREMPPDESKLIYPTSLKSKPLVSKHLDKLCYTCGVGPRSLQKDPMNTYKEIAAEQEAGITPEIPLSLEMVYRPLDELVKEGHVTSLKHKKIAAEVPEPIEVAVITSRLTEPAKRRNNVFSFAAQQRAQNLPVGSTRQTEAVPKTLAIRATQRRMVMTGQSDIDSKDRNQSVRQEVVENKPPTPDKSSRKEGLNPVSIFSPQEMILSIPNTRPDEVLRSARWLHTELERVLNTRSTATKYSPPQSPAVYVNKWVDYTTKFGVSYILNNGSIGCVLYPSESDSNGLLPRSCVLVRNSEKHILSRDNPDYADKNQLVPLDGQDVEFYENRDEEGLFCVKVDPKTFAIPARSNVSSTDVHFTRKKAQLVVWKRFANYMTVDGKDVESGEQATGSPAPAEARNDEVVKFYQRFGDVGCWLFGDGHYQFNFPDHTKIVLSSDGYWCDFFHLSLEAAAGLRQRPAGGVLAPGALEERGKLSWPLQTLLNFARRPSRASSRRHPHPPVDAALQGVPEANDFRRKIDFVRRVLAEWLANGGVGRSSMETGKRLRWEGARPLAAASSASSSSSSSSPPLQSAPLCKLIWVTVGARGGDDRRVAWLDPSHPMALERDVEDS